LSYWGNLEIIPNSGAIYPIMVPQANVGILALWELAQYRITYYSYRQERRLSKSSAILSSSGASFYSFLGSFCLQRGKKRHIASGHSKLWCAKKAWRFLWGESPHWSRPNQPIILSVAAMKEVV